MKPHERQAEIEQLEQGYAERLAEMWLRQEPVTTTAALLQDAAQERCDVARIKQLARGLEAVLREQIARQAVEDTPAVNRPKGRSKRRKPTKSR